MIRQSKKIKRCPFVNTCQDFATSATITVESEPLFWSELSRFPVAEIVKSKNIEYHKPDIITNEDFCIHDLKAMDLRKKSIFPLAL